jgi:hypothetical protein
MSFTDVRTNRASDSWLRVSTARSTTAFELHPIAVASNARVVSFIAEIRIVSSTQWRIPLDGFLARARLGERAGFGSAADEGSLISGKVADAGSSVSVEIVMS